MALSFWDWSVTAYRAPGAEETLLTLQDAHGLNVNLLLWCVWNAAHFAEPDETAIRRAMMIARDWEDEIVAPLRRARRALKSRDSAAPLRAKIKDAELAAEREVQSALDAFSQRALPPAPAGDAIVRARRSLAAYARAAGAAKTAGFSVSLLEKIAGLTVPSPDSGDVSA